MMRLSTKVAVAVAVVASGMAAPVAAQYSPTPGGAKVLPPTPSVASPKPVPFTVEPKPTGPVYLPGLYVWTAQGTPTGTVMGELAITGDAPKYMATMSGTIPEGLTMEPVVVEGSHVRLKGTYDGGVLVINVDAGGDAMVGTWSVEGVGGGPFSAKREKIPGS
jgi:hypothetical protein